MTPTILLASRAFLLAAVLTLAPAAHCAPAPAAAEDASFAAAMAAYQNSHWAQSYAMLATLADHGHPEAARIASQMHRWGPRLYGQHFQASAAQRAQWQQAAWCGAASGAAAASCTVAAKSR